MGEETLAEILISAPSIRDTMRADELDPLSVIETVTPATANIKYYAGTDVPHRALFYLYRWNGIAGRLVGGQQSNPRNAYSAVSLPMPGNLETTYGVNYSEESVGGLTAGILNAVSGGNLTESLGQAGTGLIGDFLNKYAIGQVATAQVGIARNPHQVVFLQGVDFRTFQFNYKFSPQSREEALELLTIINTFKYAMSVDTVNVEKVNQAADSFNDSFNEDGTFDSLAGSIQSVVESVVGGAAKNFFAYPDYFEIQFFHHNNPSKYLFKIGPSVLTSFNVQYHPNSVPSYATPFDADGEDSFPTPTQVDITMQFKELEIITRDRVRGGR